VKAIKEQIYEAFKHCFSCELSKGVKLKIANNLPEFEISKWEKRQDDCEFCLSSHSSKKHCEIVINGVEANSEEGEDKITLKDI